MFQSQVMNLIYDFFQISSIKIFQMRTNNKWYNSLSICGSLSKKSSSTQIDPIITYYRIYPLKAIRRL